MTAEILRVELTEQPIQLSEYEALVAHESAGAVVGFAGVVRDHDDGRTAPGKPSWLARFDQRLDDFLEQQDPVQLPTIRRLATSGVDHLLFLLCLLIPVRSLGEILRIVTAFTVGQMLLSGVVNFTSTPCSVHSPIILNSIC